jgi:hypothetical protein
MDVNIADVPAEIVEGYEAAARERGLSLDALLREWLIHNAPAVSRESIAPNDWERALDECLDGFPAGNPLPDDSLRRENIYGREDNW